MLQFALFYESAFLETICCDLNRTFSSEGRASASAMAQITFGLLDIMKALDINSPKAATVMTLPCRARSPCRSRS